MGEEEFVGTERSAREGQVLIPSGGLFARRNTRAPVPARRRPVDQILNTVEGESDALKAYKVAIPVLPSVTYPRPVPTCCQLCFPENRRSVNERYTSLGIRNSLNFKTKNKTNAWHIRQCSHFFYFWRKRELLSRYKVISAAEVLQDAEFLVTLEKLVPPEESEPSKVMETYKAVSSKFLENFGARFIQEKMITLVGRIGGWLLSRIFSQIFDSVCVHDGQLELLRSHHTVHPIVYVPLQKSNWDHFVLSWVLLESDIAPPVWIARRSLMTDPLLGKFARLMGCLGTRDSFGVSKASPSQKQSKTDQNQNQVVTAALESYLKQMFVQGMSLEFSVEQHRSRDGLPGTVFVGTEIFHLASNCIKEEDIEVEEAYIVPVSVSYEKFPEREIIGKYSSCSGESSRGFFRSFWKLLGQKLGSVRVNFGHPISVREYQNFVMTAAKQQPLLEKAADENEKLFWLSDGYCNAVESRHLNWNDEVASVTSLSSVYKDLNSDLANCQSSMLFADSLTAHTLYDASKCNVFMSTNLLAFLLLFKHRDGVELKSVEEDMEDLIHMLREKKRDVGFSTKSSPKSIIERAVKLLGSELIQVEQVNGQKVLKPGSSPAALVELSYYSNPVVAFFAMDAVIATALFALQGKRLSVFAGTRVKISVEEEQLIDKSTELATLLKAQFLLHPPCQQLDEAVKQAINGLQDDYMVVREMPKKYHQDDEDDEWTPVGGNYPYAKERLIIQAIEDPASYRKLLQVRSLITPYLYAYAEALSVLSEMLPTEQSSQNDLTSRDLIRKMLLRLKKAPHVPPEMAVEDTVRNFVVSLKHLGVLREYFEDGTGKAMSYLEPEYAKQSDLDDVLNKILYFCAFP